MKNLLCSFVTILMSSSFYIHAQITKEQQPKSNIQLSGLSDQKKLRELVSIHDGTYQLRISRENYVPVLNLSILDLVVNSRQQNTNTSIELDEFTRLFVPSSMSIEDESFIPLETVVYTIILGPIINQ